MATTKVQSELIVDDVALAGNPTTSTQSAGNNTTRIATTAFVTTAVNNLIDSAPGTMDTLNEIAAALNDDPSFTTTVNNAIALKAPLANPTFTGVAIAPAVTLGTDPGGDAYNTTSPLKIGSTTNAYINIKAGTGHSGGLLVGDSDDDFVGGFIYSNSTDHLTLFSNNAGRMVLNDNGRVVIGGGADPRTLGFGDTGVQIEGTGATSASLSIVRNSASLDPPYLIFGKSRGGALGANTVVQDGDYLGNIRFNAADGTDAGNVAAQIHVQIDGTPGANDTPGKLVFSTTADGNNTSTARMTIKNNGNVDIASNIYLTGSNDRRIKLSDSGVAGIINSNNTVHIRGDNDFMKLNAAGNGGFIFEENGSERMRINPGGAGVVLDGGLSTFADNEGDNLQLGTGSGDTGMTFYSGSDGRSSIYFGNNGTNGNVDGAIKYFHESYTTASVRRGIGIITGNVTRGFLSNSTGQLVWGDNAATTPNYPGSITTHRTGNAGSTTQNTWGFSATANGSAKDYGYKASGTGAYAFGVINAAEDTWMSRLGFDGRIYLTNTTVGSISDRRLKKDIVDASPQWNDIKALKFKNYKWKDEARGKDTYLGLIADEVKAVSPNLVEIEYQTKETLPANGTDPEYEGVKYSIVWMKAVKALQEAMTKIETLEAKVKALEDA